MSTLLDPELAERNLDNDDYAHYVLKQHWGKGYMEGQPIRALCGKLWIPVRDPEGLPICPTCKKIKERHA